MSDDPNSDVTHLLERLDYWEKFIPSNNRSEIENLLHQAITAINALRRRVRELEGERDTANKYLDEVLDRGNKTLRARDALTAENAELKRQVESLEAQLAARNQAAEAMGVLERLVARRDVSLVERSGAGVFWVRTADFDIIGEGRSLIEAVLKAGGE